MNLRKGNEKLLLFFSITLVFIAAYFVSEISLEILLILVAFQLVYILAMSRQFLGNSILVNEHQFPDIYSQIKDIAEKLDIQEPNVFIQQDPYLNAFTLGFKKPYSIVLSSALVEEFTHDELTFVLAHEMGHIKLGHSKWLSLISPLGGNNLLLSFLYGPWQRISEYSADRAGLYVVNKLPVAISAMIKSTVGQKLSNQVQVSGIIQQIEKSESYGFSTLGELFLTHPYVLNRIEEMISYYELNIRPNKK